MSKYFKLDKDKREIVLDKTKHYNVNIDILDLIIDLKQEIERLNNIINSFEEELEREINIKEKDLKIEHNTYIDIKSTLNKVLKRLKELKGEDKE